MQEWLRFEEKIFWSEKSRKMRGLGKALRVRRLAEIGLFCEFDGVAICGRLVRNLWQIGLQCGTNWHARNGFFAHKLPLVVFDLILIVSEKTVCWGCGFPLSGAGKHFPLSRMRKKLEKYCQNNSGNFVFRKKLNGYSPRGGFAQYFNRTVYKIIERNWNNWFYEISCGWVSDAAWHSPPLKGRGRGGVCNVLLTFYWWSFYVLNTDPTPAPPLQGRGVATLRYAQNVETSALSAPLREKIVIGNILTQRRRATQRKDSPLREKSL